MNVDFFELNESEVLSTAKLNPGAFICCKDSTNMYMVPTAGGAPVKMAETTRFLTESARSSMLAPINGKRYFCYDTGKMWIYYNEWICLNPSIPTEFSVENVVLTSTGSVTVTDSRIKSTSVGTFVPDNTVSDLVSDLSVTCSNGSAVITGTTAYDVTGTLKIINN